MKKVLVVNGVDVLTIDMEASDVMVAASDSSDEMVSIAEYIKVTLESEMLYDGVHHRCDWQWEDRP